MPAEGSHNESRPITSLRFLQPQPSASTSASEGVQTTARHQRHQTSAAAASKHSAGTISDGFAGAKGLPKQAQIEHATPSAGKPSLLKPMSALFAPVQQGTKSAITKTSVDPRSGINEIAPSPVLPTNRPTPRRPKRLLASENEVQEWEREADRVDELRRAKTPRTKGDGDDKTVEAAAAVEDDGRTTAGETEIETKHEPLPRQEPAAKLRPITFLHPHSRPANKRAAADTTTTTTKIMPHARKPDKSPVATAVYDLSSLAPIVSRRSKIEASDPHPQQKPKLPPATGAQRPVALSKLTSAVFVPIDDTRKKNNKEPPQAPQAALSAFRPRPLSLGLSSMGGNGMDEGQEGREVEVEEWSPKKRKGGYLASGMAARASSLLSAARTEQTLWLHDFSRRLAQLSSASSSAASTAPTSNGRTTTTLAAELRPDLRLRVLQVLSFGTDEADSFMTSDRRRERRTTLAVCRLLVVRDRDRPAEHVPDPASSKGEPSTRETQGLVFFSLHDHHFSGGGSTSMSSVSLPSATKNLRSGATNNDSSARTLAVPTIPPDLRSIRPGVEVWVWEPFHEVALLEAEDVHFADEHAPSSGRFLSEEGRGTPVPVGDVSVQWQDGGAAADGEAKVSIEGGSEAMVKKGLVCGRFAILT